MADADEIIAREELLSDIPDRPRDGLTILRLSNQRLDLEVFPPIFVEILGVLKADATHLCQQESGVFVDNLDPASARKLAAALQERGEECFVVPAAEVVMLPRPYPVHAIEFTKSGLALRGATTTAVQVGFSELTALALAHVAFAEVKRKTTGNVWTTNVGLGFAVGGVAGAVLASSLGAGSTSKLVKSSATHQLLDLAVLAAEPLYFRIDARQFDYSILGDQVQTSSTANIQTLARWLLTYAPQLATNLNARVLQQTGTTRLPIHSAHGLTSVTCWLLNLAKFGKQPITTNDR